VILGPVLSVPLTVNKGYGLPNFVGRNTLVLVTSYSGKTEETIAAFQAAREAGARIVAISSGADLAELCGAHNLPVVTVPAGSQTRASFGYLLFSSLLVFERLALCPSMEESRREAAEVTAQVREEMGPSVGMSDNLAKQIAHSLQGCFPLIYGSKECGEVAALRWRQLLNENSKMLAHHEALPEMNHNEIAVWDLPQPLQERIKALFLRDHAEDKQMRRRTELSRTILERVGIETMEVWSRGESLLARLCCLTYMGDLVSFYLAMLNGVDPTPIEAIAFLRGELARPEVE
jgi:glucose/mannose-6-phosphate isomerase